MHALIRHRCCLAPLARRAGWPALALAALAMPFALPGHAQPSPPPCRDRAAPHGAGRPAAGSFPRSSSASRTTPPRARSWKRRSTPPAGQGAAERLADRDNPQGTGAGGADQRDRSPADPAHRQRGRHPPLARGPPRPDRRCSGRIAAHGPQAAAGRAGAAGRHAGRRARRHPHGRGVARAARGGRDAWRSIFRSRRACASALPPTGRRSATSSRALPRNASASRRWSRPGASARRRQPRHCRRAEAG